MTGDPTPAELLAIIERARVDRLRREALDRYWRSIASSAPKPSEWPCSASRECMASTHQQSCPIHIAETVIGEKK